MESEADREERLVGQKFVAREIFLEMVPERAVGTLDRLAERGLPAAKYAGGESLARRIKDFQVFEAH